MRIMPPWPVSPTGVRMLASDVGRSVHDYASARGMGRAAVDLSGLTEEQQDWLMGLSEQDLQRLAVAGEAVCKRAVSGKRCGIVGLPTPRQPIAQPDPGQIEDLAIEDRALAESVLAHRIRMHRTGKGMQGNHGTA